MLLRSLLLTKALLHPQARTQLHNTALSYTMPGVSAHPPVYHFSCDEIVDDSEPERAELRNQGRRARAKQVRSLSIDNHAGMLSTEPARHEIRLRHNRSVIELSGRWHSRVCLGALFY